MNPEPVPDRRRAATVVVIVVAVVMVLAAVIVWRLAGPESTIWRIGIGLWCAGWIGAPLLFIANEEGKRGRTFEAMSTRERLWRRAIERHDAVLAEYAPYEMDPFVLLEYPAISDITHEPTAAFFDALSEAQTLRTDTYPDEQTLIDDYQLRVGRLERAWESARRHALKVKRTYLDEGDAADLDQAVKLLRHAQGASSEHERQLYVERAQRLLRELVARGAISIPPRVMGSIEASARKSIESSGQDD